jgi:hypothetical protein
MTHSYMYLFRLVYRSGVIEVKVNILIVFVHLSCSQLSDYVRYIVSTS